MRNVRALFALVALATWAGCGGGSGTGSGTVNNPALSSIQVSGPATTLAAGASQQMSAIGSYNNGTQQNITTNVQWSSSDTSVATINSSGMLTAKAHGSVTVTAVLNNVSGSTNLTVTTALVSITVSAATLAMAPGTAQQFIATGNYSDGSTQNLTGKVTWASSNTAAATVSNSNPTQGLTKALATGSTAISASMGQVVGTVTLTVTSATIQSIAVSPANANIPIGIAQQYTAIGTFSDSSTQDITGVVRWQSSATGVASITVSGLATALNMGSTTISAAFGGVNGSAPLTVNIANLASLSITPSNPTIAQNTTAQFKATGTFNDGSTRNLTNQVTWTSSDTTVATIGANSGIAAGQTRSVNGTAIIAATIGQISASTNLTVSNATVTSITVAPSGRTIPVGGQAGFQATGLFSDSSSQDITSISKWMSSDPTVAKVGSGGGSVLTATGVAPGLVSITAAFSGITGSATLTVSSATLDSLNLTPQNAILAPASTLGYTAVGTFSDGSQHSINGNSNWSSSDPTVATVSGSGTATGQSAGAVTITAQSGTISGTASLIVEGGTLASIAVTPGTQRLPQSIQGTFNATGTFTNGDVLDLTSVVTWTSSSAAVATISNAVGSKGSATAVGPGSTTISAVFGNQVGTATLSVSSATLTSVNVTPANASLNAGSTQQYVAIGTFSDQSMLNITGQANWSSSDVSVAVIDPNGVLTSAGVGTASISASLNGVTGMTTVTVH
jgi:hypothetical protein